MGDNSKCIFLELCPFFDLNLLAPACVALVMQGSTGEELALFMRLHLLQGIVNFHQQNLVEATKLLSKVFHRFTLFYTISACNETEKEGL